MRIQTSDLKEEGLGRVQMRSNRASPLPVPQACQRGHSQHLEHLLFYGAEPGAQNASGNTALHICALYNKVSPRNTYLPFKDMLHTSSLKPPSSATSVHSQFLPTCSPIYPSVHLSIHPSSICLPTHLSILLLTHPPTHPSIIHLQTYPLIYPPTYLLTHPPVIQSSSVD